MRREWTSYDMLLASGCGQQMLKKKVYVNDQLIGEAQTWSEVHALIENQVLFTGKPGVAEGPSGFYVSGSLVRRSSDVAKQRVKIRPLN